MAYTDNGLILADAEALPNGGAAPGGINHTSEVLAYDLASAEHSVAGLTYSDPSVSEAELVIDITTNFTNAEPTTNADCTVAFELVSMPLPLANLDDCGSGTGKDTMSNMTMTTGTDVWDLVSDADHGLSIGTPFYVDTLTTTATPAVDTVQYVSALSFAAASFKTCATRAAALAGGAAVDIDASGSGIVQWYPFIHATTGGIPLNCLQAGARFVARVQPYAIEATTKSTLQYSGGSIAPYGSAKGVPATYPAWRPVCNRYLALRCLVANGAGGSVGRFSANLGVNLQSGERHFPTAAQIA